MSCGDRKDETMPANVRTAASLQALSTIANPIVRSPLRFVALFLVWSLVVTTIPLLRGSSPALGAAGDPFRFIYDQAGRLVDAVTATDSAKYAYDAVGNITAITRTPATTPSVISFEPHSRTAGATGTISGTRFCTTPAS